MIEPLLTFFCRYSTAPSAINKLEDETYPVNYIDNIRFVRKSIINFTFRYDAVLNPQRLCDSLVQLLDTGDWRKLGGRLRLNSDGDCEIKVPKQYSTEHPAIRFCHADHNLEIDQHPTACRLPRETGSPSVQDAWHDFRCFITPPELPNSIQHYLTTDEPMICLFVTSFNNATLVSLTFPHILTDAMGMAALLQAWSAVLADLPVPPVLGARGDVLAPVGTSSDENAQTPYLLEDKQLKGVSLLVFAFRTIWDTFTQRNIQARTIFLPAKFMTRLRQTAQIEELGSESQQFISDGDLITAWGSRMILESQPKKKSATIYNVFDMRGRLNDTFSSGPGVYLQNLVMSTIIHLPSSPKAHYSIGHIARGIRQAIVELTTDTQARSLFRIFRKSQASTGMIPMFGSSDSMVIYCTNWSRARLREAPDFGPAVVSSPSSSDSAGVGQPGIPVSYWGATVGTNDKLRDTFMVYGKDGESNYWVQGFLRHETWNRIEEEFAEYVK